MQNCEENENKNLIRQGLIGDFEETPLIVYWYLTEMCNYQCSYCVFTDLNEKRVNREKYMSFDDQKKLVDFFYALNRPQYYFSLIGGEPTIHPHFMDPLGYIEEKFHGRYRLTVTTNGWESIQFWQKFCRFVEKSSVNTLLHVSVHFEYAKKEHLIELVKVLSTKLDISFRVMAEPEHMEEFVGFWDAIIELRKEYFFFATPGIIYDPKDSNKLISGYTTEILGIIDEKKKEFDQVNLSNAVGIKKDEIIVNWEICSCDRPQNEVYLFTETAGLNKPIDNFNHFCGMYCLLGINKISIRQNGLFETESCGLGNCVATLDFLNGNNNYMDLLKIVECSNPVCLDLYDWYIPKFRNFEEAVKYRNKFIRWQKQRFDSLAANESKLLNQPIVDLTIDILSEMEYDKKVIQEANTFGKKLFYQLHYVIKYFVYIIHQRGIRYAVKRAALKLQKKFALHYKWRFVAAIEKPTKSSIMSRIPETAKEVRLTIEWGESVMANTFEYKFIPQNPKYSWLRVYSFYLSPENFGSFNVKANRQEIVKCEFIYNGKEQSQYCTLHIDYR